MKSRSSALRWFVGSIRGAVPFVLAMLPTCGACQQQSAKSAALDATVDISFKAATLDDILDTLSKRCHVNMLADGGRSAQKIDLQLNCPLQSALDTVADRFDCTWRTSRAGSALFEKRYKDPKMRPQANLPEMLEMTRSIVRALTSEPFDSDESHWQDMMRAFSKTLTADEMKLLQAGGKLSAATLLPEQQHALQQAILSKTFSHPINLWSAVQQALENMPVSYLAARKRDDLSPQQNAPEFDYLYVYRTLGGALKVLELPHISYGNRDVRVVTP